MDLVHTSSSFSSAASLDSFMQQVARIANLIANDNEFLQFQKAQQKAVEEIRVLLDRIEFYKTAFADLTNKTTNVTLIAKDDQSEMTITANREVLAGRSPFFRAMFNDSYKENLSGVVHLEEFPPAVLSAFVQYFYHGEYLDHNHLNMECLVGLLQMANKYQVEGLSDYVDKLLVEANISVGDAFNLIQVAKVCGAYRLAAKCMDIFGSDEVNLGACEQFQTLELSSNVDDTKLALEILRHKNQVLETRVKILCENQLLERKISLLAKEKKLRRDW